MQILHRLVDSATEGDFTEKLDVLEKQWSELENSCNAHPGFFEWFTRNKSAQIINTMLKQMREEAGLGSPPAAFTTNASETVNSIIKSHVSYKSSQLVELTEKLKSVIDEQEKEVERAVITGGNITSKRNTSI